MAPADHDALIALHNATGGASWNHKKNWDTDAYLSQWDAVEVNDQDRVVALSMRANGLAGILTCSP